MNTDQPRTIKKEMGITHKDFYDELPNLLGGIPCHLHEDTISFELRGKRVEINLGLEEVRKIGPSVTLPVTIVTLRFFAFSEEETSDFIRHFNLKFMKGGG